MVGLCEERVHFKVNNNRQLQNLPKQISLAQVTSRDLTSDIKPTQLKPYLLFRLSWMCHFQIRLKFLTFRLDFEDQAPFFGFGYINIKYY